MDDKDFKFVGKKVVMRVKNRVCETPDELMSSSLFLEIVKRCMLEVIEKEKVLSSLFHGVTVDDSIAQHLTNTFKVLCKLPIRQAAAACGEAKQFVQDPLLLAAFVEYLYNYWRGFDRYIICDSEGDALDRRPYRTFNDTVGTLTHLIRAVYRDVEENITGDHPRIYRQVTAGAEVAAISLPKPIPLPARPYSRLAGIPIIRQVLINPPMILNPPMNKRAGQFMKVDRNPVELIDIHPEEWLCYPAKVGPLFVLVYFHERFFELGFSLCNLFELAGDAMLKCKPDAVYLFGVPDGSLDPLGVFPTVFFEDAENDLFSAAIPARDEFGYFGYLKKMVLTLHNVRMMRRGKMPFHGAFVRIALRGGIDRNVLFIGDTGAGKSEMLEAFRVIGAESIRDIIIIADDMGSIDIDDNGDIIGYGTEIGAFLRLDDLRPGYAFGQIDRSIIMSPSQVNARIVLPVTTYETVMKGHRIDMVLYANNYEQVDDERPVIERFRSVEQAFKVFREGTVMSKGTTTSSGIVHSYFANIFGPPQYRDLHDKLALVFFNAFFSKGVYVGQIRTRLGITGYETIGPETAARELLQTMKAAQI